MCCIRCYGQQQCTAFANHIDVRIIILNNFTAIRRFDVVQLFLCDYFVCFLLRANANIFQCLTSVKFQFTAEHCSFKATETVNERIRNAQTIFASTYTFGFQWLQSLDHRFVYRTHPHMQNYIQISEAARVLTLDRTVSVAMALVSVCVHVLITFTMLQFNLCDIVADIYVAKPKFITTL